MSKYNVFQAIPMSFYSKKLYRDIADNWGGKAFAYLFLLLILSWIGFTFQAQRSLNIAYNNYSSQYVNQIPIITFKDGIVHTPENRPYLIHDDANKTVAIIDTTGQYTNLDQTETMILLTPNKLFIKKDANETREIKISNKSNYTIQPEVLNGYVKQFIGYVWILLFIFFCAFSFIYRMVQAFIYSIIGKIFSSICSIKLGFGQIVQIALVSITPVIILSTLFDFFAITFVLQNFAYFILAICYLFYGIVANKS